MKNFDDWSQKRFLRWLYKNHPKPEGRWVEFTLTTDLGNGLIEKITMADDYETCLNELAYELENIHRPPATPAFADFPQAQPTFLIQPAKRRKKKRMWVQFPAKK